MSNWRGDYMGFYYNGVHSSDLGIVRTSDGSRFNENLLPTMQDKTAQVPGGDGTYYFGSYYTQRPFTISFAFDALTEEELEKLRQVFGDKKVHDLIFDERPYKVYSAKVTGTATIKYIAFDEGETNRLYKGEGSIQFTCYYPFARCWSTSMEEYKKHPAYTGLTDNQIEERINEWWVASRISEGTNFGDMPAPFWVKIPQNGSNSIKVDGKTISWNIPMQRSYISYPIKLDTKTGLALDGKGNICNEFFTGDLTLKVPVGKSIEYDTSASIGPPEYGFDCLYY